MRYAPGDVDAMVGANIREARIRIDMPQAELGRHIGQSNVTVWKYENGRVCIPVAVFVAIAAALDVPPARLLQQPRKRGKRT